MVETQEAIDLARALLGTPYARMDCIGLIVRIIRTGKGGRTDYRTAGTHSLWRSYTMSAKYKDLTWRQEGTGGARPGMLAFKRRADDVHHVGLVTEAGTVIHSSSEKGCVVETALDESWSLLAIHRDSAVQESREDGKQDEEACGEAMGMQDDEQRVTIVDDEGSCFRPKGGWRVYFGSID